MGEVLLARDTRLGRNVALKVLPGVLDGDADRLSRFEREARILASLNHPNIATMYGIEETDGVRAIAMELVEGETLAAWIARERYGRRTGSIDDVLNIAKQIVEALDAAHERGIVHRDLKPTNVMITPAGVVKVLDFGLAKTAPDRQAAALASTVPADATQPGLVLGTVSYMSPEQARGLPVDRRTDIWAFGCVLYEMLAGRTAFSGQTTTDVIVKIVERDPDWSALPWDLPPSISQLLRRCFQKDPRRRLRDIGDALPEVSGEVVSATVPSAPRLRWFARGGWFVAALSIAIAAAALLARPSASSGPEVIRIVRLTSGPPLEQSPVISHDGKWVAYLSTVRGVTDVWVKFIAGGDPVNLTASTNLTVAPQIDSGGLSISPDDAQVAFNAGPPGARDSASIGTWVVPAPFGGVPRRMLDVGRGARWSPDGNRIAFIVQGGTGGDAIWVADADGANPREVAPKRGGFHKHWVAWSRDGKYIYFNYTVSGTNTEPSGLYRVSAAGGPIEPVIETVRRAVYPALTPDGGLVYAANPSSIDLGLWWQPVDRRMAPRQLTTGLGEYAEPSVSGDGSRIVATLYDNRQSLVGVSAAGTDTATVTPVTNGDTGDLDPTLSPDGARLVFSSTRSGNRNLWSARPDGGDARPLTSGESIDDRPAYAPDGRQIAFVSDRGGVRGIWLISADGGSPHMLIKAQVLDTISWSPDGSKIVYAEPGEDAPHLSIVDVATGTSSRLHTRSAASGPAWSPTSDLIAYIESQTRTNKPALVSIQLVDSTGGVPARPVYQPVNAGNGMLAWQPGGHFLAVVGNSGSVPSVAWIVEPGNTALGRMVSQFPVDTRIRGVTWSHDGTSLILGRQQRESDVVLIELRRPPS